LTLALARMPRTDGIRRRSRPIRLDEEIGASTGSRSTVVWNPWTEKEEKLGDLGQDGWTKMLCVETANAAEHVVTIPPGGKHRLAAEYSVEKA
jgi:D-hexose-6-phosphate mutarotase